MHYFLDLARNRNLVARSAYDVNRTVQPVDDEYVTRMRELHGGNLTLLPQSQTRWYVRDLETAQHAADNGNLGPAARLWRACKNDGVFRGVLSTRTDGLVRLPRVFRGRQDVVDALRAGSDSVRSVFDEMFPPAEIAALAADGIGLGVGVGELIPVAGRDYPVFARLEPEFLSYRWSENQWYYRSIAGLLPIFPGDGRWILHVPGGRVAPWNAGIWPAVGRAYVDKDHARMYDANWQSKLANPARVAISPQGAGDAHKQGWFQAVMAWGVNSVFGLTPGYDVKLLESNGRGSDSFARTIARSEREMIIAAAGQEITTDGGSGFQNNDVHSTIRTDLIKATADGLAYTLNTQGLPAWIVDRFGDAALDDGAIVEWDITPPKDRKVEADGVAAAGAALKVLLETAAMAGIVVDVKAFADRFQLPLHVAQEMAEGAGDE